MKKVNRKKTILFIGIISLGISLFLFYNPFEKAIHQKKIALQPFSGFSSELAQKIKVKLHQNYGAEVYILPERELPKNAFVNIKSPRYRADSLLRHLKNLKPDSVDHVLGLCRHDISTTKRDRWGKVKEPKSRYTDWGVFGLGYRPGPSCVVSSFRLKRKPAQLFESRLLKVCIHEIGHNLGLKHCETAGCVMADAAEKLSTVDQVEAELCAQCKSNCGL